MHRSRKKTKKQKTQTQLIKLVMETTIVVIIKRTMELGNNSKSKQIEKN